MIYEYKCEKCKRTFEVKQSMKDKAFTNHKEVTEGHQGLSEPCDGKIERLISRNVSVVFKGEGWTRKFHTRTGKNLTKIDRALGSMGIDDSGSDWSKREE